MKLKAMRIAVLSILLLMLAFNIVFAGDDDTKDNNVNQALIMKMALKAETAKEGDWKTLADCSRTLLDERIICDESYTWLEKSISIQSNYYNLSLMGDYYTLNREFDKAYQSYLAAILSAQKERKQEVIPGIQWKLLVAMGTRNYYDYYDKNGNNN